MNPMVQSKLETVQMKQDDLEYRRKEADEKLQKLRELIEQVSNWEDNYIKNVACYNWLILKIL